MDTYTKITTALLFLLLGLAGGYWLRERQLKQEMDLLDELVPDAPVGDLN